MLEFDLDKKFCEFLGGWVCCVVFVCVLVVNLDILLLDELINYLDVEVIIWFEDLLFNFKGLIIFILYDCLFICKMVICIVDLDCGKLVFYLGNYDFYLEIKVEDLCVEVL